MKTSTTIVLVLLVASLSISLFLADRLADVHVDYKRSAITEKDNYDRNISILSNKISEMEKYIYVDDHFVANFIKSRNPQVPRIIADSISEEVVKNSVKSRVPASVIIGVIAAESDFNPMLISKAGARGLMQLMPKWHMDGCKSVNDLHEIDINIMKGTAELAKLLEDNKIEPALHKYVGGREPLYVKRVLQTVVEFEIERTKKLLGRETNGDKR